MDLKDVAAVSGKSGLFKVIKPTRTGVILETIDADKKKLIANASSRVSILKEISLYTTTGEGSVLLEEVLLKIADNNEKKELAISSKSSEVELRAFVATVLPDYDEERVYFSDLKKLVTWYNLLITECPDLFVSEVPEKEKAADKKPAAKKPAAKKATAKASGEKKPAAKKPAAKKATAKSADDKKPAAKKAAPKATKDKK